MKCYDFLLDAIIGRSVLGDFFAALGLFLSAALLFVLILSPWVRLSTDGFPSIQPRKEGSIPSIDALSMNGATNIASLVARYIRSLRNLFQPRERPVEDGPF